MGFPGNEQPQYERYQTLLRTPPERKDVAVKPSVLLKHIL